MITFFRRENNSAQYTAVYDKIEVRQINKKECSTCKKNFTEISNWFYGETRGDTDESWAEALYKLVPN